MLRALIRVAVSVAAVVIMVLSWLQASVLELTYPLGARESAVVYASDASVDRRQWFDELERVAQGAGVEVFMVVPDVADYLRGRDVFAFGAEREAGPVDWLDPGVGGYIRPVNEIGEANVSTTYALGGPAAGRGVVKEWMESVGARADWRDYSGAVVRTAGQSLALLVFGASLVLLAALLMGWYAQRARSRATRLVAGMSSWRIQAQDLLGWGRETLPALAVTLIVVLAVLALWRGPAAALAVGSIAVAYVVVAVMLLTGIAVVLSLLTWPRAEAVAQREPPTARFGLVSDLLKALTFALALAALPLSVSLATDNFAIADQQAAAAPLHDHVAVTVSGIRPDEYDQMIPAMGRFVAGAEQRSSVGFAASLVSSGALRMAADSAWQPLSAAGYDGLALVNVDYLDSVGIAPAALRPAPERERLASESMGVAVFASDAPSLGAKGVTVAELIDGQSLPVPAVGDAGFASLERPLLLVFDQIAETLSDDAVASYLTTHNILFRDASVVPEAAREAGVSHVIGGIDRAADYTLLTAQFANRQGWTTLITLAVLVVGVVVCVTVSSSVHAIRHSKRLFPLHAAGLPWRAILRARYSREAITTLTIFTVVSLALVLVGQPWSPWLLVGVAAYLAYTWASDIRASRVVVENVAHRTH